MGERGCGRWWIDWTGETDDGSPARQGERRTRRVGSTIGRSRTVRSISHRSESHAVERRGQQARWMVVSTRLLDPTNRSRITIDVGTQAAKGTDTPVAFVTGERGGWV